MKKEAYFIQMFSHWYGGISIGNVAGVAYAKFNTFDGAPIALDAT